MTKMTDGELRPIRRQTLVFGFSLAFTLLILTAAVASAQRLTGTENGEWRYLGGDAGHTRSSPVNQINAENFENLQQQWIWRGDNFGPNVDYFNRSTPIYVDGILYTQATPRRQVIAIDPATGEFTKADPAIPGSSDGRRRLLQIRQQRQRRQRRRQQWTRWRRRLRP